MNTEGFLDTHHQAMSLMHKAGELAVSGSAKQAKELLAAASRKELAAAALLDPLPEHEPRRGILHLSAAALALRAGDYGNAERITGMALSGYPTPGVSADLHALLEAIRRDKVVDERGRKLTSVEMELRLFGPAVCSGFIDPCALNPKVTGLVRLIHLQTAGSLPFDVKPDSKDKRYARHGYTVEVSHAPGHGCAVTVRLRPTHPVLSLVTPDPQVIVNGVIDDIEALQIHSLDGIAAKYPEKRDLIIFLAHAAQLFPDGKALRHVHLCTCVRRLALHMTRDGLRPLMQHLHAVDDSTPDQLLLVKQGRIELIDRARRLIRIREKGGASVTASLPEGLEDLVRQYWGRKVIVDVKQQSRGLLLVGFQDGEK